MRLRILTRWAQRYLPTRWGVWLRRLRLRADAGRTGNGGAESDPVPPLGQAILYGTDPQGRAVGAEYLRYFRELGGLQPHHRVLEIGCGIGRVARALTGYLAAEGAYCGFDIVPEGIVWCRDHITPRHPQFHFEWADVRNRTYHPRGMRAAEYAFLYEDEGFDFVYTTSVFTHMRPADLARYLSESARVLKRGGRCLHTFFLLNPDSTRLLAEGRGLFEFAYALDGCRVASRFEPEKAVAHEEARVRELYAACGLAILEPIRYGAWCGRPEYLSGQDIVVAEKAAAAQRL